MIKTIHISLLRGVTYVEKADATGKGKVEKGKM